MLKTVFVSLILFIASNAHAYPEYAATINSNRCTACHISPVGGGPRNANGKLFGAHGFKINPWLVQDYASADVRVLLYYPQRPTDSKGGMGVMMGSLAVHPWLDADKRIRLVLEANVGGFQAGTAAYRDTYGLFQLSPDDGAPHMFDQLIVGRFRAPFGIMTDEHRTYTRIQTASEYFTFETGALLSGTPLQQLHYDLALVNGEKSAGNTVSKEQAERWGGVLNLRYMPGPIVFGASASFHEHAKASESRKAGSLYTVIPLARWTRERIPLTIHLERTIAKNWGSKLGQGFVNDPNYGGTLNGSQSDGWLGLLTYNITPTLKGIYKYERLTPDRDFPIDLYERHGLGVRWYFGPDVSLQVRTEFAKATHPTETGATAMAGQDATWAVLHLEL